MPPKDKDWTDWYCQTSHKMVNGRQYTLTEHIGYFTTLTIYCWHTHELLKDLTFFMHPYVPETMIDNGKFFYNCGERHVEFAKHYAEHQCHALHRNRLDVTQSYTCLEEMDNDTNDNR